MFRRKDENDTTPMGASDATNTPGTVAPTGTAQQESNAASAASPAAASTSSASAAAAPVAGAFSPAQPRPAAAGEASRTAAPAGYRPTPVADIGRPAAAPGRPGEPARTPGAGQFGTEKALSVKTNRRVLTVGNDILLKGEIATCDRLVIEGRVEARLSEVHTVEIAEVGSFKGTAEVEDAEISGVFEGDLVVRNRIVIYATGEVRGNITYGEIEIERGGRLMGDIKTVQQVGAAKKAQDSAASNANAEKKSAAA